MKKNTQTPSYRSLNTTTIAFYPKPRKGGFMLYGRLRYRAKTKDFSTGIEVADKTSFDPDRLHIKKDPAKTARLKSIEAEFQAIMADLRLTKRNISLEWVLGRLMGANIYGTPTIQEVIQIALDRKKQRHELGEIGTATITKYETWYSRASDYFTARYGKNAPLDSIKPDDAKALELWNKTTHLNEHNVSVKFVMEVKSILNVAFESEWISRNPFMLYRAKREKKRGVYLTQAEVEQIEQTRIIAENLDVQKDVFLFMCYTGLAYIDCLSITPQHLHRNQDGDRFLELDRKKSGENTLVWLHEKALHILDKYSKHPHCTRKGVLLPVISNQNLNIALKQLGDICGLKKVLSCHVARRTFATWLFNNDVDAKTITRAMGHTSIDMTARHYGRQSSESVVRELKRKLS